MAYNYEFRGADLSGTRVVDKDFSKSIFMKCCLNDISFQDCDLRSTTFERCELNMSLFGHCKFDENTKFINCDMYHSEIRYCDLAGVSFERSRLEGITFDFVSNPPLYMFPSVCPEHGGFTAYKALYIGTDFGNGTLTSQYCIAELYIPKLAKRLNYYGSRKCRSSGAKVVKFYDTLGNELNINTAYSIYSYDHGHTVYSKGKYVYPNHFNDDRTKECSNGIHFFMTFKEAVNYAYDECTISLLMSEGDLRTNKPNPIPSISMPIELRADYFPPASTVLDPHVVVKLKEENNGQS